MTHFNATLLMPDGGTLEHIVVETARASYDLWLVKLAPDVCFGQLCCEGGERLGVSDLVASPRGVVDWAERIVLESEMDEGV